MKSIVVNSFVFLITILFVTAGLEFAYRKQLIDFYWNEFSSLNPEVEKKDKRILVFGDSFSAHPLAYVSQLRDELPNTTVFNAAVSGTGLQEVSYMFKRRYTQANPDLVLIQIYPANDLSDIHKVWISDSVSTLRGIYYTLSNRIHFFRFLNYKLRGLGRIRLPLIGNRSQGGRQVTQLKPTAQNRAIIRNYPPIIRESIHLENQWAIESADYYLKSLESLLAQISPEVKIVLLLVPHYSQVNLTYYRACRELGADLPPMELHFQEDYEFVRRLRNTLKPRKNMEIVNPLLAFREEEEMGRRLFYPGDIHLNDAGNEVLASEILQLLKENSFN